MKPADDDERRERFAGTVGRKADRRLQAQRRSDSPWFWLGMLGLVGWSVAVPTLAGVALGLWLDRVTSASFSWVITLLIAGLTIGVLNAWFWIRRESEADDEDPGPPHLPPPTLPGDGP